MLGQGTAHLKTWFILILGAPYDMLPPFETARKFMMTSQKTTPNKFHALAWMLWSMGAFFYAYQYILRVCPSVMIDDIMAKFAIDAGDYGTFSGVYYLGYALMHLPIGILLDRFGPKWVMPGCVLISVLGILPLTLGSSWPMAIAGRFLVGAGSSGAILGVFKILRLYFPDSLFSRLLGFSVTVGLAGAIYGGYPVRALSLTMGWESVLMGVFVGGGVLALLMAFLTPTLKETDKGEDSSLFQDLKEVFSNKYVLGTALFAALMVGPLEGFADVWAFSYLVRVYGYDPAVASSLPSLIFIGMGVGSPILAYLAEKWKAYYPTTLACALGMAVFFGVLLLFQVSPWIVGVFFFLIGVLSAYQVLALYMNSKHLPDRLSGVVTAFTNMVIMSFGYVFHTLIAKIMVWQWDGAVKDCVPVYSPNSYVYGLGVIPVALVLAFFGFWWVKGRASLR